MTFKFVPSYLAYLYIIHVNDPLPYLIFRVGTDASHMIVGRRHLSEYCSIGKSNEIFYGLSYLRNRQTFVSIPIFRGVSQQGF